MATLGLRPATPWRCVLFLPLLKLYHIPVKSNFTPKSKEQTQPPQSGKLIPHGANPRQKTLQGLVHKTHSLRNEQATALPTETWLAPEPLMVLPSKAWWQRKLWCVLWRFFLARLEFWLCFEGHYSVGVVVKGKSELFNPDLHNSFTYFISRTVPTLI